MKDDLKLPGMPDSIPKSEEPNGKSETKPKPRFETVDRDQMVMRPVDIDQLIDQDHAARAIWEFVGRLDLTSFSEDVRAVEGERGRPAHDPRLMISLWVYGYSRGVSSAREIARLCEYDPAFQWLTGMKIVNHHSLSDFRVDHGAALDKLFIEVLAVLMGEGLVILQRVMHDGTKIEACGSRGRFRTRKSIDEDLKIARKHVEEMKKQSDEDVKGRAAKAQERAARQRVERLEAAQKEFEKIKASQSKKKKKAEEMRVSENEPEARIMKYRNGAFAPSYNAQISTDRQCTVIVAVGLSQAAGDSDELESAIGRIEQTTGKLPEQLVADGAYGNGYNIHMTGKRGIELITPATNNLFQLEKIGIDKAFSRDEFVYHEATNSYRCPADKVLRYIGKEKRGKNLRERYRASADDCGVCHFKQQCCPGTKTGRSLMRLEYQSEVDIHAAKMQTEEARSIYKQRGQTAEFPSAWIKQKIGLRRFRVRGLVKAELEMMWACLTYNIQQWIRLIWRTQCLGQIKT
jgi:transposase